MLPDIGLGPILFKDFTIAARRWQTFLGRAIAVGCLGGVVSYVYWEVMAERAHSAAGVATVVATTLLTYAIVTFGACGTMIQGISEERERQTLGLLITSPLTPGAIAASKILAGMARTAVVTLCILPVLFVGYSFGGTEATSIIDALIYVAAGGVLATAASSLFLGFRLRGNAVSLCTYGVLFLYLFPPLFLQSTFAGTSPVTSVGEAILATNPFFGALEAILGNTLPFRAGIRQYWILGPWESLGLMTTCLLVGGLVLRWGLGRETRSGGAAARLRRQRDRSRKMGAYPVLWYEARVRKSVRRRWLWFLAVGIILLSMGLLYLLPLLAGSDKWAATGTLLVALELTLLCLVAAAVRGAATGGDVKQEIPLLSAPVSFPGVALQKVAAVLRRGVPILVGLAILWSLATALEALGERISEPVATVTDLLLAMASIILGVAGLGAVGALAARLTASSSRGAAAALAIFFFVAVALPLMAVSLRMDEDAVSPVLAATDPIYFAVWVIAEEASPGQAWFALILEGILVSLVVWATAIAWDPLTRRRA